MSSFFEKPQYTTFTLWDIDREFQRAYEAYEQWLSRNRRRRTKWECFSGRNQDDELGRSLCLGRRVQTLVEIGMDSHGAKFDRGDSTCHAILAAQLIRVQQEIHLPLLDCAIGRTTLPIPYDDLLTTAKSVRRTCLTALRDQCTRLRSPTSTPFLLPPPRFSVNFCPYATKLRQDRKAPFHTKKLKSHDRHDEREVCPECDAHIAVTPHSGLVEYRRLLFSSHSPPPSNQSNQATFACTSCYKTFTDSYAFLEHVFQKEIGSGRSCLKRWTGATPQVGISQVSINQVFMDSDPALVEKCLRNCLKRELGRLRALKEVG